MAKMMGWKEAIIQVLEDRNEPMHYSEISEVIADKKLRKKLGATPAQTVGATLSTSILHADSPFKKVGRGRYILKDAKKIKSKPTKKATVREPIEEAGFINAFGMYWAREKVLWSNNPKILGRQQTQSTAVNFCNQKGVYLLYDGHKVVYVGRTTEQPIGLRLRQHIDDRLNGRWDRFSWFGIYSVTEAGELDSNDEIQFSLHNLIATMEAVLIEGLEPPQNRKRGDDFRAIEYLQVEDDAISRKRDLELFEVLKKKMLT
ncbi:MAG: HTH domain-containing protein [bacterium]|nr:HTH domain-containing protein [bacterium]